MLSLSNRNVRVQEDFVVAGSILLQKLYDYIVDCDLVIHLVGASAGATPQEAECNSFFSANPKFKIWLDDGDIGVSKDDLHLVTYTQWEAYFALFLGKRFFCYYGPDQGIAIDRAQALHRNRIENHGQDRGAFTTRESLSTEVLRSLQSVSLQEKGHSFAGYSLLTEKDFERDAMNEVPKMATVGRRPTLALLRDEQYMFRTQHLSELEDALRTAAGVYSNDEYCDLPVFWIKGASGSGKSVLLLQLMKKLVGEGRRVVWLDNDVASLQSVLNGVLSCNLDGVNTCPEYIFVDDLYAPRNQQIFYLDELQRTITKNPDLTWPTVVTCGPGQYYEAFRADAAGEGIVTEKWTLEKVSSEEALDIEEFFSKRSGHPVALEHQPGDEGGLFISMAVELRHGKLESFAKRFAERIADLDLLEPLKRIIALNRLYIAAPGGWLTDQEQDRLETLNEDTEFLLDGAEFDRQYIRLTHPHLSNEIYRALCSPANSRVYGSDIVEAFDRAIRTDVSTAITLLKTFGNENERLEPVDMQRVATGVSRILSQNVLKAEDWDPRQRAELVTTLAVWDAKSPDLGVSDRCGWDVRSYASEVIAALESYAAPLWITLIRSAHLQDIDVGQIIDYLESDAGLEDPSWHLLYDVLQAKSTDLAWDWQRRIVKLGLFRLEQDPQFSGSGHVLVSVIDWDKKAEDTDISDRVTNVIPRWLEANPFHHRLPGIARARFPTADDEEIENFITTSFKWFDRSAGFAKVWGPYFAWFSGQLIQKQDLRAGKFLETAVGLVDQQNFHTVGTYVVEFAQKNLQHFPTDPTPRLRRFAFTRLEETSYQGWSFFLEYLEELGDLSIEEKRKVLDLGKQWLVANTSSGELSYVWITLFRMSKGLENADRRSLVEYGEQVLSAETLSKAAVPLAANLVIFGVKLLDPDLGEHELVLSLCVDTLLRAPPNSSFAFLAATLLANDTDEDRLDRVATYLVKACREHADDIRDPDAKTERSDDALHYHSAALSAGRHIDIDAFSMSKTGLNALRTHLDAAFADTVKRYSVGGAIRGPIVGKSNSGLLVLLPTGYNGLLPWASIPTDRRNHYDKAVIGDVVDVCLSQIDEDNRLVFFTAFSPEEERKRSSDTAAFFASLVPGKKLRCRVSGTANYGVFLILDHGLTGLLHYSNLDDRSVTDFEDGSEVDLWISSLHEERQQVSLTCIDPVADRLRQQQAAAFMQSLSVGQRLRGIVANTEPYGVFVRIEHGLTGLLHVTKLHAATLDEFKMGDEIDVFVTELNLDPLKVEFSNVGKDTLDQILADKVKVIGELDIGQRIQGKVTSRIAYGAFVSFGNGLIGLLHKSKMGEKSVSDFKVGMPVELWIHSTNPEKEKVELTVLAPVVQEEQRQQANQFFNSLAVGQVLKGTVKGIVAYGVFLDLGHGVVALLHISKLGDATLSNFDLEEVHDVRVVELTPEKNLVGLALPDALWEDENVATKEDR